MARSDRKEEAESEPAPLINSYPIPLYLNQKYVFSVLAMMEGGFAQLENVKATWSDQDNRSTKLSADIGLSNVFALISTKLGGERSTNHQSADTQEVTSQRVHTPDSLFARMRERLYQEQMIRSKGIDTAAPGDYVEFAVTLRKNPLIDAIATMQSFGQMIQAVEEPPQQTSLKGGAQRSGARGAGNQYAQSASQSSTALMLKQIDVLLKSLRGDEGGTFDLIGNIAGSNIQVVLVLDPSFASDPTSTDLVDGEYTVLGKVVRVIPADSPEKISLLRKTSLGKASSLIEKLASSLSTMSDSGITFPKKIETELSGPAIQVVPVAVFM